MNKVLLFFILCITYLSCEDIFIGVVKPLNDVELTIPIDGVVSKIYVKEGSKVTEKSKILQLDSTLQELEVQRRKIIWLDKSRLKTLIAEEKILSLMFKDAQNLYESSKAISKEELNSLKIKYLNILGELKSSKISEKKEKVEYLISKEMYNKYLLKSPIAGTVTEIKYEAGEFVRTGNMLVRIVNSDICIVDMNIKKELINEINIDDNVNINLKVGNINNKKTGKIIFISPIADLSSGLVSVKAQFNNKDLGILPGLTVEISLNNGE